MINSGDHQLNHINLSFQTKYLYVPLPKDFFTKTFSHKSPKSLSHQTEISGEGQKAHKN